MPLQAQQIVIQACQTAKVPAWTTQGGQLLNMILSELCQNYDLAAARNTYNFTFNSSAGNNSGPYALPASFLRPDKDNFFYTIQGVKYIMIPETLAQFNAQVQQPGLNSYPENYALDMSLNDNATPVAYVWPPAAGSYAVTLVYYSQMPDITNPQSSSTIPWFPNQLYLLRRLTGELMLISGDDRAPQFLGGLSRDPSGSEFLGAAAILDKYLKMKDEISAVQQVTLDRRRFGLAFDKLRNTKTVGW